MGTRIYVGNLPYSANSEELKKLFSACGNIVDAHVLIDRETGRSRGFGFVSFDSTDGVSNAVEMYNGTEMNGRRLVVSEAQEKSRTRPAVVYQPQSDQGPPKHGNRPRRNPDDRRNNRRDYD